MNTRILYLYRDADNYKCQNSRIIEGVISADMWDEIIDCLDAETYFIPSQVGLPEERFKGGWTEADHPWFEMDLDGLENTDEAPTVNLTADELYKNFLRAKDNWWRWEEDVDFFD